MQAAGRDKVPLFAESETRFFLKLADIQFTFTKDDSGAVAGLVIHRNGSDSAAPKAK